MNGKQAKGFGGKGRAGVLSAGAFGAALAGALLLSGCQLDRPQPVAPPGSSTPVSRLSELGIFQGDVARQNPRDGFVPYEVEAPLYSDGASKARFVYVPPGQKLHATGDRWGLPVGSYAVKTFYFPHDARDPSRGRKLVETRVLARTAKGFTFSTYVWNDEQTDAIASGGDVDVPVAWVDANGVERRQQFHVPGTSQCQSCHQDRALGFRSRQLDVARAYPDGTDNQIEHFVATGLVDRAPSARAPLADPLGGASLDDRARSYLDANCSHCHGKGGIAEPTGVLWGLENTGPEGLPLCRDTASVDGRDRVIVPGRPEESAFLARMASADPDVHMPRGPSRVPDRAGIAVLSQWVAAMPQKGCR